ncbi:MAG: BMP family ABC transporter substrate-binding protein [Sphaerochaetaceae bacterium]|nr:BMP family ABC transporter substrate-binding protein [Sphaerochaetaceae bacterium]
MKKLFTVLLVVAVAFTAFAQGATEAAAPKADKMAVAMVTDYGDITDLSFNQTTYEACKAFAEANGLAFKYYKPAGDNTADRVAMIEKAIDEGFNVIVMPGYAFAGAIAETAPQYKDVKFVGLDVSEYDLCIDAGLTDLSNVYCIVYQEEIAGYLAGYATVKLGYTKLGYCGGMAVPAVIRYGYGYVQGAEAAAKELGAKVEIQYAYANQFFGDADITAAMDTMYKGGTEVVFACGGGVFTSVCEAAAKVKAKAIGVDVDQKPIFDAAYGYPITVTSAMKGLYSSTVATLKTILDGNWDSIVGQIANLGLVSGTDVDANYVGIPTGNGTEWSDKFTLDDYKKVVADIVNGTIVIDSDSSSAEPKATAITVKYLGNIK